MADTQDPHSKKVDEVTKEMSIQRGKLATAEAIRQLKHLAIQLLQRKCTKAAQL